MKRLGLLMVLGAALAAGCNGPTYTTVSLGNVSQDQAFATARTVFAQYFSISSADVDSGKIVGRPKSVPSPRPDRLLSVSQERKLATLQIRSSGGVVFADVVVQTQRQDSAAIRAFEPLTVNNEVPDQTMGKEAGTLTAEQAQSWQFTGRDYALERAILNDLTTALANKGMTTTRPG